MGILLALVVGALAGGAAAYVLRDRITAIIKNFPPKPPTT